jgi:hypothetical protein
MFSISIWCKQTKVCCFSFPFAANKRKMQFSIYGIPETWRHGQRDMERVTWKHGNGDM